MDQRIAMTLAAGLAVALPLLTGCGASTAPSGGSASSSSAAPSPADAPSTSAAAFPSPSSDPASETAAAKAASEKFFTTALTIGYPDTRFTDYTRRLKPLMTSKAFDSFIETTTVKKGEAVVKKLSDQRTRNTAKVKNEKVTSLTADAAELKVTYQSVTHQKSAVAGRRCGRPPPRRTPSSSSRTGTPGWSTTWTDPRQGAGRSSSADAWRSPVNVPVQPKPVNVSVVVAGSSPVRTNPLPLAVRR